MINILLCFVFWQSWLRVNRFIPKEDLRILSCKLQNGWYTKSKIRAWGLFFSCKMTKLFSTYIPEIPSLKNIMLTLWSFWPKFLMFERNEVSKDHGYFLFCVLEISLITISCLWILWIAFIFCLLWQLFFILSFPNLVPKFRIIKLFRCSLNLNYLLVF